MSNDTTKAKLLEGYGLTELCQESVGEWLIYFGFKYDYSVNNDYVDDHEKEDIIWYIWKFIDFYLILDWCMFRWIHMIDEESDQ